MMQTQTPELVKVELTMLEAWGAFQALATAIAAVDSLPNKTFHRLRKLRQLLRVAYDDREDGMRLIMEGYVQKDPLTGRPKYTQDGQDFLWLAGKEKEGRERLQEVNSERRTFEVAPIAWNDLVPEEAKDGARVRNPQVLLALADWGLVVDALPELTKEGALP